MPDGRYPLTALQKGMVYHSLLAPRAGLYVQQISGHLREGLDVPSFKEAWRRSVAHHPVLRTRLHLADESALSQEVEADAAPEWTDEDWSQRSPRDRQTEFQRFLDRDRQRGFDFSECPLMRLAVFRMARDDFHFVWTFHHALLDGRSQSRVLRELFGFYDALRRGEDYRPAESRPFRAFVDWLAAQDFALTKGFWLEFLKGFEASTRLDLVPARADGRQDTESRGLQGYLLTRQDTETLRAFAARHDLTLGTLAQASWAALLSRYSGWEDVLFGATRAGRQGSVEGAGSMVGLLINTVPMRVQLPPGIRVLDWLRKVRADWVALRRHEHTPLRDIQAWSGFGPGKPLFENILVIENYSLNEALQSLAGDWRRREFQLLTGGDYPLVGRVYADSRLLLRLAYGHATLDDDAAARMLGHWHTTLMGLTTHGDRRVADLPLLSDVERETMLVSGSGTRGQSAAPSRLHELVEAQVARTPDKAAVRFEDESTTYSELNVRANRLARHLQGIGVGPEVLVAICMARTPALVAAILAVLKAGGGYLPIDPDYPAAQIASMLTDARAPVLLTESRYLDRVPAEGLTIVCADAFADDIEREASGNLPARASAENLAYAMYTSGSTGHPKLVGVEHRSAVNAIAHTTEVVFTPEDLAVVPFADSISFDASVYRIFSPLSVGGSIVLLDSILSLPYCRWADSVTALGSAPSVLQQLLRDFRLPGSVRVVSVGAEVAGEELLAQLTAYPHVDRVINFYGPTETTIYCSYSLLMKRQAAPGATDASALARVVASNVIGKPIWNARCHVLDALLRPVPIGVSGELCVGGVPVARGYLNDPVLTATKFIPDPLNPDGSTRLYRTGDLVRSLPDGNICFIGRIDHQVKLRGVRIEPQGIEAVLNEHPSVTESLVRVVEDPGGEKHLVAYVAIPHESGGTVESAVVQLRAHLERKLPRFMVPHSFVLLSRLPRTSRGKLDFAALPHPRFDSARPRPAFVAPRTEMEEALAGIWQQVLQVERIGVDDDFLELVGDSLAATRIVSRVNHTFGVNLSLRAMFDTPTIAKLAAALDTSLPDDSTRTQT